MFFAVHAGVEVVASSTCDRGLFASVVVVACFVNILSTSGLLGSNIYVGKVMYVMLPPFFVLHAGARTW